LSKAAGVDHFFGVRVDHFSSVASTRTARCEARSRIKNFRGAWAKACKAAGVPGRLVHDFRRTAVRNLERAGVSRSAAMKLTGHKTEAVYRRYAIVDSTMLREAVDKLGALHATEANYPSSIRVSPVLVRN
jgi:integrase